MPSRFVSPLLTDAELLRQPALFRYGPQVLWALGLALIVLCVLGVRDNGVTAREHAYDSALRFTQASASATSETLSRMFERARLAARAVRAAQIQGAHAGALIEAVADGEGLLGEGVALALLDEQGAVVATSPALAAAQAQIARHVPRASLRPTQGQVLPAVSLEATTWLPLAHPVDANKTLLVYFMATELLERAWRLSLLEEPGWLRLTDAQGRVLFELVDGAAPNAESEVVRSTAQGLAGSGLWGGQRWIAGERAGPGGVRVESGIPEVRALREYRERYRTVIEIVFFVSLLVLLLSAGTAHALRRFEKKESYLRRLATVDTLTELPNRRNFNHALARQVDDAQAAGAGFALAFIDLDNFKLVNDSLGHEAGDRLLRETAWLLRQAVGERGRVFRLGGDEFTVILPGCATPEAAQATCEHIAQALHRSFDINGLAMQPRASVGAALFPAHARTPSDLMRFADVAVYQAKHNGKGCAVVYDETLVAHDLAQATLVRELEHAIEAGELHLAYQPKYHTRSGALAGFEALVRWRHPTRGPIAPGEFIGLAESFGLIEQLGDWVLERAVQQIRQWHAEGHGWQQVAVNVSHLQLYGRRFVDRLRALLERYGVPGHCLHLELTESSLATHPERTRALLGVLRTLGVTVSVDDFGTGYSSLGAMHDFDIDCLKIDRSFVNALGTAKGEEICRAVISFGHALGLRVIAEGVETEAQHAWLLAAGCDEVQGFHYARPMPSEAAIALVTAAREHQTQALEAAVPA